MEEAPELLDTTLPIAELADETDPREPMLALAGSDGGSVPNPTMLPNLFLTGPGDGSGDEAATGGRDEAVRPGDAGAQFFGIQAEGSRFVFVVDCSLSMRGRRWLGAVQELEAAIRRLGPEREFYVILFDGFPHLMFHESQDDAQLIRATPENVTRFERWIEKAPLGYNTSPLESIKLAIALQPDAIFLLTDGEFRDKTAAYLKRHNRKGDDRSATIIHTLALHGRKGQRTLKSIASFSGGTYRFIPDPLSSPAVATRLDESESFSPE